MKKIIITGGPCVGKTTTINLLKGEGIHVIDEVPRDIIAKELEKQKNNASYVPVVPWIKFDEFQTLVVEEQLKREANVPEHAHTVILDRGLGDIFGYCKVAGKTPPAELISLIKKASYSKIIFLEQLPAYETDGERKEDFELAKKIHQEILNGYKELGFDVVVVPQFHNQEKARAEFVRMHLK